MLAVDMESDSPAFDEDNRIADSEEILKMCGSLVRLDTTAEGQSTMGDNAEVQTLTAAHTSVIDFLTTQPIKIGSKEAFYFTKGKANLRMAEICLIYLRYFSEKNIIWTKEDTARYPFAQQSAFYWDVFYQEVLASSEQVDMGRLNGLVMDLFLYPTATLNWIQLFNPDKAMLSYIKSIYLNKARNDLDFDAEIPQVKPAIYYAACLGLPDIVRSLIQEGHTVNDIVGPPFGTPLVAASAGGWIDVVSLLLDSGADPNLSGYFHYGTPLAAAISCGRKEIVKMLLRRDCVDVNAKRHPPMKVTNEMLERVEEYRYLLTLVKYNIALKNSKEHQGLTKINSEVMKVVETAKFGDWGDEYPKDQSGSKEIRGAAPEKQSNHLTSSTNIDSRGYPDRTTWDHFDETHYSPDSLVWSNSALDRILRSTESMVYIAASHSHIDTLKILLEAGADPNIWGGGYGTALQAACCLRDGDAAVEILLENGARTDVRSFCGYPLHVACAFGSLRMVEMLIKAGAGVNQLGKLSILSPLARSALSLSPDARLSSPLSQACKSMRKRKDVVKLLLKSGAKMDLHTDGEDTPLATAIKAGNLELVEILLDAGSDVNMKVGSFGSPLVAACKEGSLEMAKLLIEAGVDLSTTNLVGHSALLITVLYRESQLELFEYLILQGADPFQEDKRGCNGLLYAARAKKSDFIKSILDYGINVNTTDHNGWSSLHWAVASTEDSTEIVKLLLQSGCDKSLEDKQGRTALDLATRFRRIEEIAILGDTAQAHTTFSDHDECRVHSRGKVICDGCEVVSRSQLILILELTDFKAVICCKPESWYHCDDCFDFDFCFRCILDKDEIHFEGHRFSERPG